MPDPDIGAIPGIVRYVSAFIPTRAGAAQEPWFLVPRCPFCAGEHRHFAPPSLLHERLWRIPACEAGQPSPRAYRLNNIVTQPRPDSPPAKPVQPDKPVYPRSTP